MVRFSEKFNTKGLYISAQSFTRHSFQRSRETTAELLVLDDCLRQIIDELILRIWRKWPTDYRCKVLIYALRVVSDTLRRD